MFAIDMGIPPDPCLAANTIHGEIFSHDRLPDSIPKPALLMVLSFTLYDASDYPRLSSLLSKRMPFLEELNIAFRHPISEVLFFPFMPSSDLQLSLYPSLRTLRLDGVCFNLPLPASPSLRRLSLKNYTGSERGVLFLQFMAALESCTQLEELEIHNYVLMFSTDTEPPRRPAILQRLKKLVIAEAPIVTSLLLENLYVPATADVHILPSILADYQEDFGTWFAAILPEDTRTLPILKEIMGLEVKLVENTFLLIGETPRYNKLTLEINLDFELAVGILADRDALFESTMRSIGLVVYDAPVMIASFQGNLINVSEDTWAAALAPLTALVKLSVDDTGPRTAGAITLFKALATPVGRFTKDEVTLCRSLDTIYVRGAACESELLCQIDKFLIARQTIEPKIHSLRVELKPHSEFSRAQLDSDWSEKKLPTLAEFQAKFAKALDSCFVDIVEA
ncbi:hypothetical protein BV20DRAFT_184882 [Pilatotrama ljubarskyi]|nr:hypothetical protein BV20DRAFT_184882 [Pilatotrama ljubarskyi]